MRCRWCNSIIPLHAFTRNGVCIPCMKKEKKKRGKK